MFSVLLTYSLVGDAQTALSQPVVLIRCPGTRPGVD